MEDRTGGQAFPRTGSNSNCSDKGMTLRDYFAAQAIASLNCDNVKGCLKELGCYNDIEIQEGIAEACYSFADAMIKQKNSV